MLSALRPESRVDREEGDGDGLPERLVIPETDWEDHYGLNEFFVAGTFANGAYGISSSPCTLTPDRVTDIRQVWWIRLNGVRPRIKTSGSALTGVRISHPRCIECEAKSPTADTSTVVIADRESSGLDAAVKAWNKMAASALTMEGRSERAFQPLRRSMIQYLHPGSLLSWSAKEEKDRSGSVPKVIYVDRQDTSRHLSSTGHRAILETLTNLHRAGRVDFQHGQFGRGEMKEVKEQVLTVLDADVSRDDTRIELS